MVYISGTLLKIPNFPTFPEVFQPFPIVGCGFVEDAGTNTANEFTGCANEWAGGPQLENRVGLGRKEFFPLNMPFTRRNAIDVVMVCGKFES